jgi:endonuclease-3
MDLKALSDHALEARLVELPGIGFKTARVVAAMSSLARQRFAVDTHVARIADRLGWADWRRANRKATKRQADSLEAAIPREHRRQLHACLVALGRSHCRPLNPTCDACPLGDLCAHRATTLARESANA